MNQSIRSSTTMPDMTQIVVAEADRKMGLRVFLRYLEIWLASLAPTRGFVDAELAGRSHVFSDFLVETRIVIEQFASEEAIDYLNRRALNPYWFLYLLASALVRTSNQPLNLDDAQWAVLSLRRRFADDRALREIHHKVESGRWSEMNNDEINTAVASCLLLLPIGDNIHRLAPSRNLAACL